MLSRCALDKTPIWIYKTLVLFVAIYSLKSGISYLVVINFLDTASRTRMACEINVSSSSHVFTSISTNPWTWLKTRLKKDLVQMSIFDKHDSPQIRSSYLSYVPSTRCSWIGKAPATFGLSKSRNDVWRSSHTQSEMKYWLFGVSILIWANSSSQTC